RVRLVLGRARHRVPPDLAGCRLGKIDSEEGVLDAVALDHAAADLLDHDGSHVPDVASACVAQHESAYYDPVGCDREDLVLEFAIEYGPAFALDGDGLV